MKSSAKDRNYEKTTRLMERCRQEVGRKGIRRQRTGIPVSDYIRFQDIPEKGICVTSQFENGLCGEIFWYRSGDDIYLVHGNIRPIEQTVWLKMNREGFGEVLHLKLSEDGTCGQSEMIGKEPNAVSPFASVEQFYDDSIWPEYLKGKQPDDGGAKFREIIREIIRLIGTDFRYDLESMQAG